MGIFLEEGLLHRKALFLGDFVIGLSDAFDHCGRIELVNFASSTSGMTAVVREGLI